MKTIQMTLDEELVVAIDEAAKQLGATRSAFTRKARRSALRQLEERLEDPYTSQFYRGRTGCAATTLPI